jgi:hypothetical protein
MKKLILCVAVIGAVFFVACKKDRVCTCTTTTSSGTTTTAVMTMYDVKKGVANQNCFGSQTTVTSGTMTATGDKTTCELK